jgi:hypothetical protein
VLFNKYGYTPHSQTHKGYKSYKFQSFVGNIGRCDWLSPTLTPLPADEPFLRKTPQRRVR